MAASTFELLLLQLAESIETVFGGDPGRDVLQIGGGHEQGVRDFSGTTTLCARAVCAAHCRWERLTGITR